MKKSTTKSYASWIVLGALAALGACNRSANQTNFLGEPCSTEGDCTAELVCFANKCREPCGPGGTCKNPGEICELGTACVPGSGGTTDGGGGGAEDAAQSDGGGDNFGNKGDGTLARGGLPNMGWLDLDDQGIAWSVETTDTFGNKAREVWGASLTNPADPPHKLTTVIDPGGGGGVQGSISSANGYAYWIEMPGGGNMNGSFKRAKLDGTGSVENITPAHMGQGGSPYSKSFGHVGSDLFVLDTSNQLRRYDTTGAGSLDATVYGNASNGVLATRDGNSIYWFYDTGSGTTPIQIWKATVGSPGAATGVSIQQGSGQYGAISVSGTNVYALLNILPNFNILAVDLNAAPNGNPQLAYQYMGGSGGGGDNVAVLEGSFAFVAEFDQTAGATSPIVRVNLSDKSKTKVATYLAQGGTRPIAVTATTIYWIENDQSGSGSVLMKKAKP